jgi:hypothetical protein
MRSSRRGTLAKALAVFRAGRGLVARSADFEHDAAKPSQVDPGSKDRQHQDFSHLSLKLRVVGEPTASSRLSARESNANPGDGPEPTERGKDSGHILSQQGGRSCLGS